MKLILLTCLFGLALAAPQPRKDAVILRSTNDNQGTGNYEWSYVSSDGSEQQQNGLLKRNPNPKGTDFQTAQGSFTYIDPQGRKVTTTYTADEFGYRPRTTIS